MTAPQFQLLLVDAAMALDAGGQALFDEMNARVTIAASAEKARAALATGQFDLILLDLDLQDGAAIALLHEILGLRPAPPVIVTTAATSTREAVEIIRAGAVDYRARPAGARELADLVRTALRQFAKPLVASPLLGSSVAITAVRRSIDKLARSRSNVFITGESGTGKELSARAIHGSSDRAAGPFVAFHCAAADASRQVEALFGAGGAEGRIAAPGALARATGGTLFLNDVSSLTQTSQAMLFDFLQNQPAEAARPVPGRARDIRLICTSHCDIDEAVAEGQFRRDLFFSLNVVPVHLPPLRERGRDVIDIARARLAGIAREENSSFTTLSGDAEDLLLAFDWPGNIRQLLNVLRQCAVMHDGPVLTGEMLPPFLTQKARAPSPEAAEAAAKPAAQPSLSAEEAAPFMVGRRLAEIEQLVIEATIRANRGSVTRAARQLDVAPSTLYRKIEGWRSADGEDPPR
ncbi:MAG: sigma 54-interacting transcriptional regulator [Paracoccaceae bacterium]